MLTLLVGLMVILEIFPRKKFMGIRIHTML
jgi:hypothetical protein